MIWGNVSGWCPKERINCNSYTDWVPFQKDQQDSLSADVTQITVPVHVQLKAPKSFSFSNIEPEEQLQDTASNTNLGCPLRCKICKLGGFTHPWHGTQSRPVYKCKNRSTDTLLRSQWSCGNTGLESWFSFIPHILEGCDRRAGTAPNSSWLTCGLFVVISTPALHSRSYVSSTTSIGAAASWTLILRLESLKIILKIKVNEKGGLIAWRPFHRQAKINWLISRLVEKRLNSKLMDEEKIFLFSKSCHFSDLLRLLGHVKCTFSGVPGREVSPTSSCQPEDTKRCQLSGG